jgi:hypothetical protein
MCRIGRSQNQGKLSKGEATNLLCDLCETSARSA